MDFSVSIKIRTFPLIISSFLCLTNCLSYGDGFSQEGSSSYSYPIPYALSPVYLEYLENVEMGLYHLLKEKTAGESHQDENEKDILQKYVLELDGSVRHPKNFTDADGKSELKSSQTGKDFRIKSGLDRISNNPILSLQMLNRFVKYFRNDTFAEAAKELQYVVKRLIPGAKEIEDAMDALLRLQHIYDLDSNELAEGILDGVSTNSRLSTRDSYELGRYAQESGYFTLALQWYSTALEKLKVDIEKGISSPLKPNLILKAMKDVLEEHNEDYNESVEEGDPYIFNGPIHTTNYSSIAHLTHRKQVAEELTGNFLPKSDPRYYSAMEANMMALCQGESLKSAKAQAKLKCYLDTKRHPYWTVNPLKIEILHDSTPPIIQIYDIFSDKWISYLKELSYGELERAPESPEATPRTAAYAWFEDVEIPEAQVSQRVEFITGLDVRGVEAAEALQIAAYAFGGHVEPHYDSQGPDDKELTPKGDRVTSFLVYLNEVEGGGYTAFPLLGFHVKPVKNSAVLWYTNLRNGEMDERTLHAACPVIRGQKWIATKWTHINSNILRRPCGLTPNE